MFRDATPDADRKLLAEEDRWIFKINDSRFYIPINRQWVPLTYFTCVTRERKMQWHLTPGSESVHVGQFTFRGASRAGPPTYVTGLQPHLVGEITTGEMPSTTATFINSFVKAGGNYLASDFRAPSWVHYNPNQWWSKMTSFVLDKFESVLKRFELYNAVWAMRHGMNINIPNFYAIFERYFPHTGTFSTPVGDM